jgi:hypothetical protein
VPDGVIAHPFAPQFSSSQALIPSSRYPSPSGRTPMRMRTGKRRSASAIVKAEQLRWSLMLPWGVLPSVLPRSPETDASSQTFRRHVGLDHNDSEERARPFSRVGDRRT